MDLELKIYITKIHGTMNTKFIQVGAYIGRGYANMCERGVPGGTLNLSSTGYPDHGRCGDLTLQGESPTAEPEIEPGTSWLVVRSADCQATRLITVIYIRLNNAGHRATTIGSKTYITINRKYKIQFK
jgi:hypothetical protein